jgi:UrcA family protein
MQTGLRSAIIACGLSACAVVLVGGAASAQDWRDSRPYYDPSVETVIVPAPRWHHSWRAVKRGPLNGPIEDVSISQPVPVYDLDLRTEWGVHELHDRIRAVARRLCNRLDVEYPISADNDLPCYRTAVERGFDRADRVIARVRLGEE